MADPSMNPFASVPPAAGAAAVDVSNPFDIFAGPGTDFQQSVSVDAGRATPTVSNPFVTAAATNQVGNYQEKPVNPPYHQQQPQPQPQPWQVQQQASMGNGQQTMPAQQPPVHTHMQSQQDLGAPQAPQQISSQPSFSQPHVAIAPTPVSDQNPFGWPLVSSSQPSATPSVENPWDISLQPNQPVPTPFDSFPVAQQPTNPYQQTNAVNPFLGSNAPVVLPGTAYSGAIVPSQQASNPYAGLVIPQQVAPPSQAVVPIAQPSSHWSVGGPTAAPAAAFDPFLPSPPAPVPSPPPPPVLPPAPVPVAHSEVSYVSNALVPANTPGYPAAPESLAPAPTAAYPGGSVPVGPQAYGQPPPISTEGQIFSGAKSEHSRSDASHDTAERNAASNEHRQMVPYKPEGSDHDDAINDRQLAVVPDDDIEKPKRNLFSEALAKNAPPGSAPLPKANLVVKSGFVLSRISFRTIVMKKWKQSYWVQYGPHTMLWFRSQADFDDWLNNPYHTPAQRNFLIKLAVNFVHDLYKPNVRGYQVTQARTKWYGREQVKQFKLERWMDYGPTIAAAFGSQDPREVDNLRQALVECMRNTPLEGGIRATGAVRQDHDDRHSGDDDHEREYDYSYDAERMAGASYEDDEHHDHSQDRPHEQQKNAPSNSHEQSTSPVPAQVTGDLLDDSFFDIPLNANPAQPPIQGPPTVAAPPNYPGPSQSYSQAVPPQGYGQQIPPQNYAQQLPPQAYAQQVPSQGYGQHQPPFQQPLPVYSQPSPQLHYFGFPPVPTQYPTQQQQNH